MTTTNNKSTSPVIGDLQLQITLAKEFSRILRRDLSRKQINEVITKNDNEKDSCASHEYLDANMTMDEAFINVVGRRPTMPSDYEYAHTEKSRQDALDINLWNMAWDMAVENKFYVQEELSYPRQKEIIIIRGLKQQKTVQELGRAVHDAEIYSMRNNIRTFSVLKDDKVFGYAQKGVWHNTMKQLIDDGMIDDVVKHVNDRNDKVNKIIASGTMSNIETSELYVLVKYKTVGTPVADETNQAINAGYDEAETKYYVTSEESYTGQEPDFEVVKDIEVIGRFTREQLLNLRDQISSFL